MSLLVTYGIVVWDPSTGKQESTITLSTKQISTLQQQAMETILPIVQQSHTTLPTVQQSRTLLPTVHTTLPTFQQKSSLRQNRLQTVKSSVQTDGIHQSSMQANGQQNSTNLATTVQRQPLLQHEKYQPLQDMLYNVNGSNSNRAVFVVPRRVYFDNRLESGKPRNSIIILSEVHDDALGTILACELDGKLSQSIKVLKENTNWVRHRYPSKYTHSALAIQCIGLPQDAIFNGSVAKLIYKKGGDSFYSRVVSEKPLFLHEGSHNPSKPTKGRGSIVMCTTIYGDPDKFDQWLIYNKYLGVEQIHFNSDMSFAESSVRKYPFYNESLRTGFVHVEAWTDIAGKRNFYRSQILKYHDCLYRHIGVFEYGLFLDFDDFFNPTVAKKRDIHDFFSKFFHSDNVGSVYLPWRQMKCGPIKSQVNNAPHGNLTSILTGPGSSLRSEKKCAHRLNAVLFVAIHNVEKLLPGYRLINYKEKSVYVAHNRYTNKDCSVSHL